MVECFRGLTADQRQATFRAGMLKQRGTSRMSVRFTLEESVAGGRYKAVSAPGLGVWRKSRAGVRAFAYRQRVKALAEGSAYRVKIQYRWHKRRWLRVQDRAAAVQGVPPDRPAAQPSRPANRWTRR